MSADLSQPPLTPLPTGQGGSLDPAGILQGLAVPVLVVDGDNQVRYVNGATELLFEAGALLLRDRPLADLLPADSPVFAMLSQARADLARVSQYGMTVDTPRTGHREMAVQAAPMEDGVHVVLSLHEQSMAHKIGRQLMHRNAARAITAMAAVLAHEVKNPLSGIRGAAQLLEADTDAGGRELTRLICDETDRIRDLVDRMEVFADKRPVARAPVNIHTVLEHVRRVAEAGFARGVSFVERYDPSLPPVLGCRDQLVQVFLNLVKNAAEACAGEGGELVLSTAYQHGMRLAGPGGESRIDLPLVVGIQDNGGGVPEDVRAHLFDPFVTTKPRGSGLGLALVAKIVDDHGGMIECDSRPGRTVFRVMLPMATAEDGTPMDGTWGAPA